MDQSAARHLEDAQIRFARPGFEKRTSVAAKLHDLKRRVHDDAGRSVAIENESRRFVLKRLALGRRRGAVDGRRRRRNMRLVRYGRQHGFGDRFSEDAPFLVGARKEPLQTGCFGWAEHQIPVRFQRVMENRNQSFLQRCVKINQHVAADNQVEP